jgi:hypothetical protein
LRQNNMAYILYVCVEFIHAKIWHS